MVAFDRVGGGGEGEEVVDCGGDLEGALVAVAHDAGQPFGVDDARPHDAADFLIQGADHRALNARVVVVVDGGGFALQVFHRRRDAALELVVVVGIQQVVLAVVLVLDHRLGLGQAGLEQPALSRAWHVAALEAEGLDASRARRQAGFRVFGSKPGAYGAGLQALIDERGWADASDLARAYLAWGGYAYGSGAAGEPAQALFESRLKGVEAVVQNQDNREHDLLDSDDYYQFEGGLTAAVHHLSGRRPKAYHNDHSRPESPKIRSLEEEIGRVVRARVVNPKWIRGVMRHGYKGAFEMAATVDYLFAFAATAGAVADHHFDAVFDAYLEDPEVRAFIADNNPAALREMAARLSEAIERGLWRPRSNSAHVMLSELPQSPREETL